jgi:hypothetical protein
MLPVIFINDDELRHSISMFLVLQISRVTWVTKVPTIENCPAIIEVSRVTRGRVR